MKLPFGIENPFPTKTDKNDSLDPIYLESQKMIEEHIIRIYRENSYFIQKETSLYVNLYNSDYFCRATFVLSNTLGMYVEGASAILKDSFVDCFRETPPARWNWNAFLWVGWALGVLFRYCVLFVFR